MNLTKDQKTGKWLCQFYYTDWQGNRKKKFKRGFRTKAEAEAWAREFLQKQESNLDMRFDQFIELYYFERYSLSKDLYNKFQSVKSQGEILTVHRYGSSSIYNDRDLILAIQESITNELTKRNIQNKGETALKNAVITWLSDETHKKFFDDLIKGRYESSFAGDTVDTIIEKLNTSSEASVISLMNKVFHVADEEGISALKLDMLH